MEEILYTLWVKYLPISKDLKSQAEMRLQRFISKVINIRKKKKYCFVYKLGFPILAVALYLQTRISVGFWLCVMLCELNLFPVLGTAEMCVSCKREKKQYIFQTKKQWTAILFLNIKIRIFLQDQRSVFTRLCHGDRLKLWKIT